MTYWDRKVEKHVRFCSQSSNIIQAGTDAERLAVRYLLDNLNPKTVGDFRILVNYNLPFNNPGGRGNLEIDILLINKYGIFLIEVKDWHGWIEAFDGYWEQANKYRHADIFSAVSHKSRILHGRITREYENIGKVSVVGLIVLFRGRQNFKNFSHYDDGSVFGLDNDFLLGVSSNKLLHYGKETKQLTDFEIAKLADSFYSARSEDRDEIISHYRILDQISSEEQFDSYNGVDTIIQSRQVRIKVFQALFISKEELRSRMEKIKRDTEAVTRLGSHPNILQIYEFFEDPNRTNVFYEITEPIRGDRLDDILRRYKGVIPNNIQLECISSLCSALQHAHGLNIIHRNISPEVVFIQDGTKVKLADFDLAKIVGGGTIFKPGDPFDANFFSAPELLLNPSSASPASDIYSLGALWLYIAKHPYPVSKVNENEIDLLQISTEAKKLIVACTHRNPKARPQSVDNILYQVKAMQSALQS